LQSTAAETAIELITSAASDASIVLMKMPTIFSFTRRQIGAEYPTRAQTVLFLEE
jgi:gamma-glutamylcysteine synthetase